MSRALNLRMMHSRYCRLTNKARNEKIPSMPKKHKPKHESLSVSQLLRQAIAVDARSSYELSQLSGVSPAQLSRFVREERTLRLPALDALARVLGLTLAPVQEPAEQAPAARPSKTTPRKQTKQ